MFKHLMMHQKVTENDTAYSSRTVCVVNRIVVSKSKTKQLRTYSVRSEKVSGEEEKHKKC